MKKLVKVIPVVRESIELGGNSVDTSRKILIKVMSVIHGNPELDFQKLPFGKKRILCLLKIFGHKLIIDLINQISTDLDRIDSIDEESSDKILLISSIRNSVIDKIFKITELTLELDSAIGSNMTDRVFGKDSIEALAKIRIKSFSIRNTG